MTIQRINPDYEEHAITNGYAFRVGRSVTVVVAGYMNDGWHSLGTLPSSMRPNVVRVTGATSAGSGNGKAGLIQVQGDGIVRHYQHEGSTKDYAGTFTYRV